VRCNPLESFGESDCKKFRRPASLRKKALVSWSSGKDSAWTLHVLRQSEYEIVGLLTTINSCFDRVAMHGVRRELLEAQAAATGLPLWKVPLPWPCSNSQYEVLMAEACAKAIKAGVQAVACGDLFVQDVRQYREDRLRGVGIDPIFPLWKLETGKLIRDMLAAGIRCRIACLDPRKLPASFAGRDLDERLIEEFSAGTDPCGENGEFHTFVYDGPMFANPIPIENGETVEREGFLFTDLHLHASVELDVAE
jgi:uncharacterized protein (TIGR00290 family)